MIIYHKINLLKFLPTHATACDPLSDKPQNDRNTARSVKICYAKACLSKIKEPIKPSFLSSPRPINIYKKYIMHPLRTASSAAYIYIQKCLSAPEINDQLDFGQNRTVAGEPKKGSIVYTFFPSLFSRSPGEPEVQVAKYKRPPRVDEYIFATDARNRWLASKFRKAMRANDR